MANSFERLLRVHVSSGDALDVRSFSITEGLSELFQIDVTAVSPNPDIDLDGVVGLPARFELRGSVQPNATRVWSGVCTDLKQVSAEEGGLSIYAIHVVPELWLLTQRRNHRVFQHLSEPEIVKALLSDWGITPRMRLSEQYKKRKYRLQYGESDYAFLCRMLEDAGITFYFEEGDGDVRLVLTDAPQAGEARPPITFRDSPTNHDLEHVTSVAISRRVVPGKYTVRDQDYRRPPAYRIMASASGGSDVEQKLDQYNYVPGSFLYQGIKGGGTPVADDKGSYRSDDAQGARVAQRQLGARRASAKVVSFMTNVPDLVPGSVMSILDHPKAEVAASQKLLVVSSSWKGEVNGDWQHFCQSVPASQPYYPMIVTPKPLVSGIETATVVGPPGEDVHTDEMGRVRVQFHWDLDGTMDDGSSCWIPVCHPWSGPGYGHVNLPRVGHEVIVDFLGGDPDRPIVVGRVYTNLNKVPYPLPAQKTRSGWKSQTVGGMGYNEIMFEDAAGREIVNIQAERDLTKLVKHDETVTIGRDRTKNVGHDDSVTVGNDRTHTVGNNETILVGTHQTITVGLNQTITVGADQMITLPSGNQTETIIGNRAFTLVGDLTETITGNSGLMQEGNQTENVSGNTDRTQIGDTTVTLTGSSTRTQIGEQTETVTGSTTRTQLGAHSTTLIGDRSLTQAGSQADLQLGDRTVLQAGSRFDLQWGASTRIDIGTTTDVVVGTRDERTMGPSTESVSGQKTLSAGGINLDADSTASMSAGAVISLKGGIIRLN